MNDITYTTARMRQEVEKRFLANDSNYSKTAEKIGVKPATIWKLLNGKQKESGLIRKNLKMPKPKRTRFTADIPQHLKDEIQNKRDELGLKSNGDFLEYMWLFWKHFHNDVEGGILADEAGQGD